MSDLIAPQSLKDLVDANAIRHATVVADKDVFKVTVKYGMVERTVSVRSRDGKIKERVFTSLDSVARFMREKVHLARYEIDAANFQPMTTGTKRPDTARRLKDAHAALSHSEWLEQKVAASRTGLADGTNQRIASEEWLKIRAAKQEQRDAL
ncbi:MAG: hypothetical protein ABI476_06975 [Oxalobacteraceae bacterium]